MPRFDFECPKCEKVEERLLPALEALLPQVCNHCGGPLTKVFLKAPMGFVQNAYQPYTCPITGDVISGKAAHEENLKKHNCRLLEPGEKEANEKRRQQADDSLFNAVGETVEKEIMSLPSEKKEQLAKELESGVDATVDRH